MPEDSSNDSKKTTPDGRKLRPLADTDPRRTRLEAVAGLLGAMPGKMTPEDKPGVLDASFEAVALDVGATMQTCFLCGKDVVEFAVWRVLCVAEDTCNMEFIRCRACDPDGSVTKDTYVTHLETAHADRFVECAGCGVITFGPTLRRMGCGVCGVEIVRCREKCDAVKALEEHVASHASKLLDLNDLE